MTRRALMAGLVGSSLLGACAGQAVESTATTGATTDDTSAGHSTGSGAVTDTHSSDNLSSGELSSGDVSSSGQSSAAGSAGAEGGTGEGSSSDAGTDTAVAGSSGSSGGGGDTGEALGGCEAQWPETGPVQGETPIGALALKYAGFDPDGCGTLEGIKIYLFPAMPVLVDLDLAPNPVRLDVELTGGGWADHWVSEGPVHVRLIDKAQNMLGEADGVLNVTMLDIVDTSYMSDGGQSHWLVGELHVDAPGWALHGGFTAAICWMMEGFTLCP